jgi:RNA polymerase sigma factor (sigma-70 family)
MKGAAVADADDGFAALWDAHYDDVLGYAARRVDFETARDVAAETFLVAWRRRKDVPDDRPFPWLLSVARNVLANETRRGRRQGRLWGRLRGVREAREPAADVAAAHAEGGRVRAALARLSERDREVLQLIGWEDLAPKDAAIVLGCSAKTLSVRLHRARQRLAAALAEIDTDDQPLAAVVRRSA